MTCRLVSTLDFGAVEYGASAQQSASFGRLAGSQLLNLALKLLLHPTQGFSPQACFSLEIAHFCAVVPAYTLPGSYVGNLTLTSGVSTAVQVRVLRNRQPFPHTAVFLDAIVCSRCVCMCTLVLCN